MRRAVARGTASDGARLVEDFLRGERRLLARVKELEEERRRRSSSARDDG